MIYILLCAYAYVHGTTNAFLYSRKGADALPRNEHIDLTVERCLVWALPGVAFCYGLLLPWWLVTVEGVAGGLAFSFWHNGAYYVMRMKIAYQKAWSFKSDFWLSWTHPPSPTSTAKIELSYRQRLWLFIASLALVGAGYAAVYLHLI